MTLEELYAQYGKAAVALEVAQGQFNEVKRKLAEAINQAPKEESKPDAEN